MDFSAQGSRTGISNNTPRRFGCFPCPTLKRGSCLLVGAAINFFGAVLAKYAANKVHAVLFPLPPSAAQQPIFLLGVVLAKYALPPSVAQQRKPHVMISLLPPSVAQQPMFSLNVVLAKYALPPSVAQQLIFFHVLQRKNPRAVLFSLPPLVAQQLCFLWC